MKRFAMFGVRKGETELWREEVLLSDASAERVAAIRPIVASEGWHHVRVFELDDAPPDFAKTVRV